MLIALTVTHTFTHFTHSLTHALADCADGGGKHWLTVPPAGTPEPEDYDIFHEFILVDLISQCGNPSVISGLTNGPAIALTCVMKFGSDHLKQLIARDVLVIRLANSIRGLQH